jgi:hypothetical protein
MFQQNEQGKLRTRPSSSKITFWQTKSVSIKCESENEIDGEKLGFYHRK